MTSLVESLRSTANRIRGWTYSGDSEPDPRTLMREAASEIERLSRELEDAQTDTWWATVRSGDE